MSRHRMRTRRRKLSGVYPWRSFRHMKKPGGLVALPVGLSLAGIRAMYRQAQAHYEARVWDDLAPLLQPVVIADKRVPPGYVFALPPTGVPVWLLPTKADDRETFRRLYFGDWPKE